MTLDTFSWSSLIGYEDNRASLTRDQYNCDFVDGVSSPGHIRIQEGSKLTITIFEAVNSPENEYEFLQHSNEEVQFLLNHFSLPWKRIAVIDARQ